MLNATTRSIASDHNLEQALYEAVSAALSGAGVQRDELDGIVIATSDLPEGRIIQSMVTAGAVGAVGKPLMTVASSSEHALVVAFLHLVAGLATRVLVVSWSKTSESVDFARSESFGTDPIFYRQYGLTPGVVTALAQSRSRDGDVSAAARAEADPAVPFGLTAGDVPGLADAVTAMVVAADGHDGDSLCGIRGVGWASTTLDLALRDDPLEAVRTAASVAYGMADVDPASPRADVVGVQGSSSLLGRSMRAAAGLGEDADDSPSDTAASGDAHDSRVFVGGLATVADVARRVATAAPVDGRPAVGVAICGSGFHAQNAAVFVLQATTGDMVTE